MKRTPALGETVWVVLSDTVEARSVRSIDINENGVQVLCFREPLTMLRDRCRFDLGELAESELEALRNLRSALERGIQQFEGRMVDINAKIAAMDHHDRIQQAINNAPAKSDDCCRPAFVPGDILRKQIERMHRRLENLYPMEANLTEIAALEAELRFSLNLIRQV